MDQPSAAPPVRSRRAKLHEIVFESDTLAGRLFDVGVIAAILASVGAVMLDSVAGVRARHGAVLYALEWAFTIVFTIEYVLRLVAVRWPLAYARSFFGVVDLLSIVPTYLSVLFPGAQYLLVIRVLRVLRIFRVLKLARHLGEATVLVRALRASRRKITVFVFTVLSIVVIIGALMYLVEGPEHGFTSIPLAVYWSIVTVTTVGYGDLAPATAVGRLLASMLMIMGYGIIAVPTGIVTVELGHAARGTSNQACPRCAAEGHDVDAVYCRRCGEKL